ncbi:hypothetical protein AVEN_502-1, partial [Araneus ventricosus]
LAGAIGDTFHLMEKIYKTSESSSCGRLAFGSGYKEYRVDDMITRSESNRAPTGHS